MPRTGLSPDEIRTRAIEVAERQIRKFGYAKVRLTDIAQDMGVSHAALYKHFPDKTALLDCVSDRWLIAMDEALAQVCARDKPAADLIVEFFLKLHDEKRKKISNDPELYKGFEADSDVMKPYVQAHLARTGAMLAKLVKRAVAEKSIRTETAEKACRILWDATMAWHHPRLVAEQLDEKRDAGLKRLLLTLFKGFA